MNRKRDKAEENKKIIIQQLIIILAIILVLIVLHNVYTLIKKPTSTARVKEGTLTLEESVARLYYKRGKYSSRREL